MLINNRTNTLIMHIIACVSFLLFPYILWHGPLHENMNIFTNPFLRKDMLGYLFAILFFYFNYYVLIPKLYFQRKHVVFWSSIVVSFIVITALIHLCTIDIFKYMNDPTFLSQEKLPPPEFPGFIMHRLEQNVLRFSIAFVLSLLLRINDQWKRAQKEKTDAEISYLRAQINPHFLFNTLNSIYSMSIEKSPNTPTAVVKLSGMMRYAITEAHKDFVPLEKEITYIADYIDLQNYRLGHTVKLSHRVSGDPAGKKIAPLILISIVENAFKYGVNPEENSSIMVDLTIHEYFLVFLVRNNKVRTQFAEREKSGIGIQNTRNRLNMIYPGKHKFEIQENAREYSVLLTLQLT